MYQKYSNSKLYLAIFFLTISAFILQAQTQRQAYPEEVKRSEIYNSVIGPNQFMSPKETNGTFATTVYTFGDITVFSYFDNTVISVYDANGILKDTKTLALDKYQTFNFGGGVFRIDGNKTYTVLTGDAISYRWNGYFAVDQAGRALSTKLNTWMSTSTGSDDDFIVFSYEDNTGFTIKNLTTGSVIAAGTLSAGQHYSFRAAGNTPPWQTPLQVTSTKSVSALSYEDQDYYVPSSNGTFVGTLFYGYSAYNGGWENSITVTSYSNNNTITVKNTNTGTTISSYTLQAGQVHTDPITTPTFWTVTSTGTVSAANIPFSGWNGSYSYMTRAIDQSGRGFGTLFYVPTVESNIHVFSFETGNTVTITRLGTYDQFPYTNTTQVWTGTLDEGKFYTFLSSWGKYVYKIESSKNVSVLQSYSGAGADFMPLAYSLDYPDLAVSTGDIQYSKNDADINAGDNVTVTVTVHNYGNVAASNVVCYAYDGDPDAGGNAPIIGTGTISNIAVNGTGTFNFTYLVPASPEYHQLVVKADPANQITESNESNNKAQRSIRPSIDLQPPLAISVTAPSSLILQSGVLTPNPFTVHLDIFNTGSVAATNVTVTLELFNGLTLATGSLVRNVGTINASTTATVDFSINALAAVSGFNLYKLTITASNADTKVLNRAINVPDAVPPSAPLVFNGQVAGSGSASFTWNANSATDLAGYYLYYSTDGTNYNATGANQGNSPVLIINATAITLTGLSAGNYWFMLKAFDSSNNLSSASQVVQLTITGSTTTQVLFYGNGNGTTYSLTSPNSGYVFGANSFLDVGKYQRFDFTGSATLTEARIYFSVKKTVGAADNFNLVVRSVDTNGAPKDLLYSKTYSVSIIDTSNKGVVYNTFVLDTPLSVTSPFFIGIEWTGTIDDSFAIMADPNSQGDNQKRAWEKWSDGTYHDMYSQYTIQSVNLDADAWIAAVLSVATGVEDNISEIPSNYVLYQNYPNPFNPSTKIRYSLPQTAHVKLTLYNVLGVQILTLVDSEQSVGNHEIELNGNNLASGVYFIKLNAGNYSITKKIMLMK